MDYYLNLINTIGIHTLLGLSAYLLILTGQVSMAQAGFFRYRRLHCRNSHRNFRVEHSDCDWRCNAGFWWGSVPGRISGAAGPGLDAGGRDRCFQ